MPITYQKLDQLNRIAQARSAELTERVEQIQKITESLSILEFEAAAQISNLVEALLDPDFISSKLQTIDPDALRNALEKKDRKLRELVLAVGDACNV